MAFTPRPIVPIQSIRSKQNKTGATIPKGTVVKMSAATDDLLLIPTALADAHYGVAMADILDQAFGDIQINGQAVVLVGGTAVVRGNRVTHDVANFGKIAPVGAVAGTNYALVGLANRSEPTLGNLVEVELAGPGITFQG
jgi:hypothetical protein